MSGYKTQVGGNHYTKLKIQPMQYSMGNGLDPLQHTIIKYVTRFRDKAGIDDLHKAKHCLDLLIEHEQASAKTANWPESAELHIDVIGQNGEHYEQVKDVPEPLENKTPLTRAELMQQTWFMNSATLEDRDAFIANGVPVESLDYWDIDASPVTCGYSSGYDEVCSWFHRGENNEVGDSEIHRIGNNFYWGAPE